MIVSIPRFLLYIFCICLFLCPLFPVVAQDSSPLVLSFLGDIMAHDVNFRIKDFSVVYAGIKEILLADDLSFSNLEAPVDETLSYKSYPQFNIHREYVQAAINAGIEVFPLANNHTLDQGTMGIYETLGSLMLLRDDNEMNIYFSGTRGNNKHEYLPVEIRKKGWRIGFIPVTQFLNGYVRSPYVHIVNYNNNKEANAFLSFVKKVAGNYDLFIISYHAGGEYKLEPEQEKIDYFRKLVHAGADIVYGHHPHVLQPYEEITINGCKKLILYSMGNLISGQRWAKEPYALDHYRSYTGDSMILVTKIKETKTGPSVYDIKPILITNHINEQREVVIETYENILATPLTTKWENYYKDRFEIMNKLVSTYGSIE